MGSCPLTATAELILVREVTQNDFVERSLHHQDVGALRVPFTVALLDLFAPRRVRRRFEIARLLGALALLPRDVLLDLARIDVEQRVGVRVGAGGMRDLAVAVRARAASER